MFRSSRGITDIQIPTEYESSVEEDEECFNCDLCSEGGWSSDTELFIHQGVAHTAKIIDTIQNNPNYCRVCIKNCHDAEELLKHVKSEHLHSSEESFRVQREIFACDYCKQIFFNKNLLIVHIVNVHDKNKSSMRVHCSKCPKRVPLKALWTHLQSHQVQSVSTCPVCLVKCKSRKHVLVHMRGHPKYLKCDMCLYETKREELFRQHILTKHKLLTRTSNERMCVDEYFIPSANVVWKYRKSVVIQGLELMNGIRVCILCREICMSEDKMKDHIHIDHNLREEQLKPEYLCTCGETFTNRVLLKHHQFKLKGDHKTMCQ